MRKFSLCAVVDAAICYCVGTCMRNKAPGCIGIMNGANGAKVEYVGGDRIIPIC